MRLALSSCTLRPWREDDAASLAAHANNREVWINLRDRFPHPYTLEHAHQWIARAATLEPGTQLAVEVEGHAAGGIGLEPQHDIERVSAEIGFWLGERFWGHGIMTAAVGALSEHALNERGLLRLYAWVLEWNPASMRVLEKSGYTREAWLRKAAIKDGRIVDRVLYARIAEGMQ
jgi:[ribosomal protein S5]-alanine N-acetyltransferase